MNIIEANSIKLENGCWMWNKKRGSDGYGRLSIKGVWTLAHRYSWEIHNQSSASGMFVIHSCDNPACVNPDHLRLGTASDNMQDCIKRGRQVKAGGNGTKLTQEKADEIRRLHNSGILIHQISRIYSVSRRHIRDIIKGIYWKGASNAH